MHFIDNLYLFRPKENRLFLPVDSVDVLDTDRSRRCQNLLPLLEGGAVSDDAEGGGAGTLMEVFAVEWWDDDRSEWTDVLPGTDDDIMELPTIDELWE